MPETWNILSSFGIYFDLCSFPQFYFWKTSECMKEGTTGVIASGLLTSTTILPPASAYGRGFYPDWWVVWKKKNAIRNFVPSHRISSIFKYHVRSGTRNTCINDGNEPEYMQEWPEAWISNSAEECCNLVRSNEVIFVPKI